MRCIHAHCRRNRIRRAAVNSQIHFRTMATRTHRSRRECFIYIYAQHLNAPTGDLNRGASGREAIYIAFHSLDRHIRLSFRAEIRPASFTSRLARAARPRCARDTPALARLRAGAWDFRDLIGLKTFDLYS